MHACFQRGGAALPASGPHAAAGTSAKAEALLVLLPWALLMLPSDAGVEEHFTHSSMPGTVGSNNSISACSSVSFSVSSCSRLRGLNSTPKRCAPSATADDSRDMTLSRPRLRPPLLQPSPPDGGFTSPRAHTEQHQQQWVLSAIAGAPLGRCAPRAAHPAQPAEPRGEMRADAADVLTGSLSISPKCDDSGANCMDLFVWLGYRVRKGRQFSII